MFKLHRQKVLDECRWTPEKGQLRYIEARAFASAANALTSDTYREGDLNDSDVEDWLHQRGRFTPPSNPLLGEQQASIRLLVCERLGFHPLEFGLSKASLLAIENEIGLPVEMLPLFRFNGGSYSYHFRPLVPHDGDPEQLVITIKVPQMYQVANYGLCLTHSFKTSATTGFFFGWNMHNGENWKRCMNSERLTYLNPHLPRISDLIKSEVSNWSNPLLLPVVLLEDHVYNADRCKAFDLSPRTTKLERDLRVTKAGRNVNAPKSLDFEVMSQEISENRMEIITKINTTLTDVVTFACNLKWDTRYCDFLRSISKDIQKFSKSTQGRDSQLDNTVDILSTFIASIIEHTDALKNRLDIQLDVLYNLVAQVDSNVNATIAATTGLDSIAMKALAFVTTLFLPPTFVATLFSMSMFDWQSDTTDKSSDSDEESHVVSKNFGLYWAVSLPLSIVVLLTWCAWWYREKNRYRRKYPHVNIDPDIGTGVFNKLRQTRWWTRKELEDVEKLD